MAGSKIRILAALVGGLCRCGRIFCCQNWYWKILAISIVVMASAIFVIVRVSDQPDDSLQTSVANHSVRFDEEPDDQFEIDSFPIEDVGSVPVEGRPVALPRDGYVTSKACRDCHPSNYKSWYRSYHRRMTQVASPAAVVGDFQDVVLDYHGRNYHLERRGNEFWVKIPSGDGMDEGWRQIVLTTGSHHRQWYWFSIGEGRKLDAIPFVYLIWAQRWLPSYAAFIFPPDPESPPNDRSSLWGSSCVNCHTTHGEMRSSPDSDSQQVEFGISCEACHGPGEQHVRWNESSQEGHPNGEPDSNIINPAKLSHRQASEMCGGCHSVSINPLALRDNSEISNSDKFLWSDGQLRVGGREYDAVIETPCFQGGEMSCLSCHTMHPSKNDSRPLSEWANDQLKPEMHSDTGCLQCHDQQYARREHTHHELASSGSRCYNCHMPHTNYALLKAIRNHQVAPPTVSASVEVGRPNACNICHLDKSLGWAADHLFKWYRTPRPALSEDQKKIPASVLLVLSGDAGQRAMGAWYMGWKPALEASGSEWIGFYLSKLLTDPYPAVRVIASRSFRELPGMAEIDYDPVAPFERRQSAAAQVLKQWSVRWKKSVRSRGGKLSDPNIMLGRRDYMRLLHQRDDRPVNWIE